MQRGLTEHLITASQTGFKADILQILAARNLFTGVICDIGLHQGQTLLELYGTGLPIRHYYGFDPNAQAITIAERLITLNPCLSSARLLPWACANQDIPIEFFRISEVDSGATIKPLIRPDWYEERTGDWVPAYRLDTISPQLKLDNHFFLKIDVEGGELDVLQGAQTLLQQWRPIIQCEVLHAHRSSELSDNNHHKHQLLRLLQQQGYILFLCHLSNGGRRLADLELIQAFPSAVYADSPHTCDYLFLPQELVSQFNQ
ncbi:FkbM family methyltransferase [Synechococcus elongatus IITB4]|uniref:FkbM family methyltransferase n=1 Tax=Synechococcus elongatus TaxID=32046 RepID=UPI0030D441CB